MQEDKYPNNFALPLYALWVGIAAIIIPGVIVLGLGNLDTFQQAQYLIRGLAASAAFVAAIAAGVRLVAHDGLRELDRFGKMLGFVSAVLAAWLSVVLIIVW